MEAEFAGGDQQLRGQTVKAQEAANQPGKATSVVVQQSKVSADECKPWSADILKMTTMIKSLATSVDKIHKKLVKNEERKEHVVAQTAEVVPPLRVVDGNLQDPGQQQRQQQPPWWKHKTEGFKPRGFKPQFLRRVNITPTGCYRCGEEGHFAWECMSERLPTVPRMDMPVQQQQQVAAPTSPESGNGGGMLRGPPWVSPLSGQRSTLFQDIKGLGPKPNVVEEMLQDVLRNYEEYQARIQLELFSLLGARGEVAPLLAAGTMTKQGIPILNPDPLARLIGWWNEADICVNGLNVRALLDTGAQVTSMSDVLCARLGLRIYKLKGIAMEGTGGICIEYVGYTKIHVALPECSKRPDSSFTFSVPAIVLKELEYQKEVPVTLGVTALEGLLSQMLLEEIQGLDEAWRLCHAAQVVTDKLHAKQASIVNDLTCVVQRVSVLKRQVIPPGQSRAIWCSAHTNQLTHKVNVVVDRDELSVLPVGIQVVPTYTMVTPGSMRVRVMVHNHAKHSVILKKRFPLAAIKAANLIPDAVHEEQWAKLYAQAVGVATQEAPRKEREWPLSEISLEKADVLTTEQRKQVEALLVEFGDVFSRSNIYDLGKADHVEHDIKVMDERPFKQRYHTIPPHLYEEVRKHIQEMLDVGVITKLYSPWVSPVVLVWKKDKGLRICIDYRKLNARTVRDSYTLPRMDEILNKLHGSRYFSALDLKWGYWQVPLTQAAREMTAFTVGPLGFYEFLRMPFGLTNAPSTFQWLMETAFNEVHLSWILIYLDDIIIPSSTVDEQISRLRLVFQKL